MFSTTTPIATLIPASGPLLALAWPWWVLIGLGILLLVYLIVTAAIIAAYARKVAGLFIDSQIANRLPPIDLPQDAVTEWFTTADGVRLRGIWLRAGRSGPLGRVIVFSHSTGEDATSAARYAAALIEAGYDVFAYDNRGCGKSEGVGQYKVLQWISDREVEDLASALRHVRARLAEQGGSPDVGMMGISRGGSTSLFVAPRDEHVVALATDGSASTDDILWNFILKWAGVIAKYKFISWKVIQLLYYPIAHQLSIRWAQSIARRRFPSSRRAVSRGRAFPLLCIQAERDRVVNVEAVEKVLAAARTADKRLWIIPKARHNEGVLKEPEHYRQALLDFFGKHFPVDPAASSGN